MKQASIAECVGYEQGRISATYDLAEDLVTNRIDRYAEAELLAYESGYVARERADFIAGYLTGYADKLAEWRA